MRGYCRTLFLLAMLIAGVGCTDTDNTVVDLGAATGCDAAEMACTVKGKGITITLVLGPEVQPLKAFPVSLEIYGDQIEKGSVIADFQMQGMDMGVNRYRLLQRGEQWIGSATLPVCSRSRMDWFAQIEFVREGKRHLARFPFHTEAN